MCRRLNKSGFSLVELLTVIGIIAVLAAIIFPVMGTVREQARKNNCMTNLRQIALAARMFKQTENRYPERLGPAFATDAGGGTIPIDSARQDTNCLYPGEVNDISKFHCLSNPNDGKDAIGLYQPNPAAPMEKVYCYNSYDYYAKPDFGPTAVRQYGISWAAPGANAVEAITNTVNLVDGATLEPFPRTTDSPARMQDDYARQLKWRTPPENTVVTWCLWHADNPYTDLTKGKAIVVFLDGHTEVHQAEDVVRCMWRIRPKG